MTLGNMRELGVPERLGLKFADEYRPLLPRGKRSKAEGAGAIASD